MRGEQRKVCSTAVGSRPEWIRRSRGHAHSRLPDEEDGGERRNNEAQDVPSFLCRADQRAGIADVAAPIDRCIGVEDLAPHAGKRHRNAIVAQDLWREIDDDQALIAFATTLTQPSEHAVVDIIEDQPFESCSIAITLVQGRRCPIERVEIAHQRLHSEVLALFEQVPVERVLVPPFLLLRKFIAHEQQLLAGVTEHEAVVDTQVREALPTVARHPAKERALAMHYFIVRQRQYEILSEGVKEPERDLMMMILAMNRILADERERVIHPP